MSTSVHIYAIPEAYLTGIAGKNQPGVLEALVEGRESLLQDIDDETRESVEEDPSQTFLSCEDALRNIIAGTPTDDNHAPVYASAYEFLCEILAYETFNDWSSISGLTQFLDNVDAVARKTRGDLNLQQLIFGGSPLGIPMEDVVFGWWDNSQVEKNLKKLRKLNSKGRDFLNADDPNGSSYVAELLAWLECTAAKEGGALVAISY